MRSFVETTEWVRSVLMYGTSNWHVSTVNVHFLCQCCLEAVLSMSDILFTEPESSTSGVQQTLSAPGRFGTKPTLFNSSATQ